MILPSKRGVSRLSNSLPESSVRYRKFSICCPLPTNLRAYQKIADVFEQCSYDYSKNSETTKAWQGLFYNGFPVDYD
jgi:hypothetical protein